MTREASGKVPVAFAKGVMEDVVELTTTTTEDDRIRQDEAEALKRRVAD